MKLAFCLFKYFPYGGLQRDFLRIAKACHDRGHAIDVYTMTWEGPRVATFNLHILNVKGKQNHTRVDAFIKKMAFILADKTYDLIIGFNKMPGLDIYYAADGCYQAKARPVWSFLLPRYRLYKKLEKAVFTRGVATQILLLAPKQKKLFIQHYQTEPERFHLLPPGIAKDRIAPENSKEIRTAVRQSYEIKDENFILLMVGSGFKTKGLDRAIIALAALPKLLRERSVLWVIGQDDSRIFQKLAKRLQIADQVKFLGPSQQVPQFLLAADLLVHPAYHENTGTVLLEAMASGLPVFVTDVCDYAAYIKTANAGYVLPSPFQQALMNTKLANMLESLADNEWTQNALAFTKQADIYSLSNKAVEKIEFFEKQSIFTSGS